ncbi:MAG: proton-conducting transporter membrane subunit [Planctomycetota bacterium]|nr:proton-conducting transporter membrane subunit [Planctomycetota bacterium]
MDNLLLPIVIPGAVGLLVLFLPARMRALHLLLGIGGALATFGAGALLIDTRGAVSWPWMDLGGLQLDFALKMDAFSSWAVAFTGLMAVLTAAYGAGWFRGKGGAPGRYYAWLLLATAGACGVLLADNLLLLVLFWELVTLMLFLLAATGREEGAPGAAKAFGVLGLGDMALLVGVVLIGLDRTWSISELAASPLIADQASYVLMYVLLLVAAMAKAGAMPLHSWIPTMATGTHASVMAFLPGAVDKILGIYLLARISLDWFVPGDGLRLAVMTIGALTILGAVFMAMIQHDLRRLLSFHAVSQVGYMLLGIGTGTIIGVVGGLFHMLNNAIYKACLFLGAGSIERETGTMDLGRLGGLVRVMPLTFGAMFVAALAISGIPPLNGFASKWLIYEACVAAEMPLFLIAALFGSALTLASFVKVLHSVFWGPKPTEMDGVREGGGGIGMPLAMVTLAGLCILLGVFAAWPLDNYIGPAVGLEAGGAVTGAATLEGNPAAWSDVDGTEPVDRPYPLGTLEPLLLTGLLAVGVLVLLLLAHAGQMRMRRVRPVFVGGQPFDRDENRFPGTEFYRTVQDLPAVGPALRLGASGQLDPYEAAQRAGTPAVRVLRRLHSGLVRDYLFWCLLGIAVVIAVLIGS